MPRSRKFSATSASSAAHNQYARKPCEWFVVEASDDRMPWGGMYGSQANPATA